MTGPSVSIIVPAYNEEQRLGHILLQLAPLQNEGMEILCIDDGSSDKTREVMQAYESSIRCFYHKKNLGKSDAIATGIQNSTGEIIVFIDADLEGDIQEVVRLLTRPLQDGSAEVAVGYPISKRSDSLFKPLSGERAYFRKDLLPLVPKMHSKGYGLELFLNHSLRDRKITSFPLANIIHPMKYEKQSSKDVIELTTREVLEVLKEVFNQKNPPKFFLRAYLYSFYLQDKSQKDERLEKLFKRIQRKIKEYIDFS